MKAATLSCVTVKKNIAAAEAAEGIAANKFYGRAENGQRQFREACYGGQKAAEIISFCKEHSIPFVGGIPFDNEVLKAQNNGTSVIHTDCLASGALKEIYYKIKYLMTDLKRRQHYENRSIL